MYLTGQSKQSDVFLLPSTGEVRNNSQVNEEAIKKSEFQVKEQLTVQVKTKACAPVKTEAEAAVAAQVDIQKSMQVKNNTHLMTPTHNVPDKRLGTKQTSEERSSQFNKDAKACALKEQGREVEVNVNKQHRANGKDQENNESTKPAADAKGEGSMMTRAVKTSSHLTAEVSKELSLEVSTAEAKGGAQVEVSRPPLAPLVVRQLPPPVIKLEPLDVECTGSCDEVQPMEVR